MLPTGSRGHRNTAALPMLRNMGAHHSPLLGGTTLFGHTVSLAGFGHTAYPGAPLGVPGTSGSASPSAEGAPAAHASFGVGRQHSVTVDTNWRDCICLHWQARTQSCGEWCHHWHVTAVGTAEVVETQSGTTGSSALQASPAHDCYRHSRGDEDRIGELQLKSESHHDSEV
jgi:hypothetical protein